MENNLLKKEVHQKRPLLLILLSANDLFTIEDSMVNPIFNSFKELNKKYRLVFSVDTGMTKSYLLIQKIGLKDGYIFVKCGSIIYDIELKKIIKTSNLENPKLLAVLKQAAVGCDTIIFRGQEEFFIFGISEEFIAKKIKESRVGQQYVSSSDYLKIIKFIRTHKITSSQIFFTYYDDETILKRKQKIIKIINENSLIYTQLRDNSIVVTDIKLDECMEFILKYENNITATYWVLALTRIFDNHNSLYDKKHIITPKISIDDLYIDKTYALFYSELRKSLIDGKLLNE